MWQRSIKIFITISDNQYDKCPPYWACSVPTFKLTWRIKQNFKSHDHNQELWNYGNQRRRHEAQRTGYGQVKGNTESEPEPFDPVRVWPAASSPPQWQLPVSSSRIPQSSSSAAPPLPLIFILSSGSEPILLPHRSSSSLGSVSLRTPTGGFLPRPTHSSAFLLKITAAQSSEQNRLSVLFGFRSVQFSEGFGAGSGPVGLKSFLSVSSGSFSPWRLWDSKVTGKILLPARPFRIRASSA